MRSAAEYSWSMKTSASASNRDVLLAPSSVCGARLVSSLIAPEPSPVRAEVGAGRDWHFTAQLMNGSTSPQRRTFRRCPSPDHELAWAHDGTPVHRIARRPGRERVRRAPAVHRARRVVRQPGPPPAGAVLLPPGGRGAEPRDDDRAVHARPRPHRHDPRGWACLLYTSDAADDLLCVDLGGRRIIKKKKKKKKKIQ